MDPDLEWLESSTQIPIRRRLYVKGHGGPSDRRPNFHKRVTEVAEEIPSRFWPNLFWCAFANKINFHLPALRQMFRVDLETGVRFQSLVTESVKDTLYLTLGQRAFELKTDLAP